MTAALSAITAAEAARQGHDDGEFTTVAGTVIIGWDGDFEYYRASAQQTGQWTPLTREDAIQLVAHAMANAPAAPTRNYLEALRQLRIFTNGSYDIYALAGRDNVQKRVAIMSAIQGFKTPQAKAGVNAIRATFYDAAGISGDTLNAQERRFTAWCHEHGDHLDVGN